MKAAQIKSYGHADVVDVTEVPTPTIAAGQVLVEVHSASLNPFDTVIREGYMKDMIPLVLPVTLGGDIAGVVTAVGEKVTSVAVGDSVYGQANVVAGNSGAFADFAATLAAQVAIAPAGLDFNQAAALPLVGVSALQALTETLNIQPGEKLFIHGGAGGIGAVAIQIAKSLGAYVATTASGEGIAYVTGLGADEVIDYKTDSFSKILDGFDAVFDTVGGDDFASALSILKHGGIAVSMIAKPDEEKTKELGVAASMQSTHVTTERLDHLRTLVEAKTVDVRVGKVFPLESIQEAFTARENSSVAGKIVLQIKA